MDAAKRHAQARPARLIREEFDRARTKALLYAKYRTGSHANAEEVVDQALAAAFDPDDSPWDREIEPDLARHLVATINRRLPAQRRKEVRRNDSDWQAKAADATLKSPRTPEELLHETRRKAERVALLDDATARLRGAGHELPARMLELWRGEIDDPPEQARVLGCSVNDIYRARETARRYIEKARTRET